ncbi:MAG: hypothetical protein JWO87_2261, partial [Phycisphaerales bacterium]|nr:hypothetical protein [Phycisphaerales bacterium]
GSGVAVHFKGAASHHQRPEQRTVAGFINTRQNHENDYTGQA